jgi:oligopeptide/dipeptide ABC transporter ATP-binding protein
MKLMLLNIEDLTISLRSFSPSHRPSLPLVQGLSFSLQQGQAMGLVGESGSGKSLTLLSIMGLLPPHFSVTAKKMDFHHHSLLQLKEKEWSKLRGKKLGLIFQNPLGRLNPTRNLHQHFDDLFRLNENYLTSSSLEMAKNYLQQVGISDPAQRLKQYPHQLSGGQAQRVMIALALVGHPQLLLADEPTTALDVTIQAQIMSLLKNLLQKEQRSLILVGHNLAVIRHMVSHLLVMYAGELVESGPIEDILHRPLHPYTKGLLQSHPETISSTPSHKKRLHSIPGQMMSPTNKPKGCAFAPRCERVQKKCFDERPFLHHSPTPSPLQFSPHSSHKHACFFPLEYTPSSIPPSPTSGSHS